MSNIMRKSISFTLDENIDITKFFKYYKNLYLRNSFNIKDSSNKEREFSFTVESLKDTVVIFLKGDFKYDEKIEIKCTDESEIFKLRKYILADDSILLVQINRDYYMDIYNDKYTYYRAILKDKMLNLKDATLIDVYNEIAFLDFSIEDDLILGIFLFLYYIDIISTNDKATFLFESKINYAGYYLDDYYDGVLDYYSNSFVSDKIYSFKEDIKGLIEFMFGYIYYLNSSSPEIDSPSRISSHGYQFYNALINQKRNVY